MKHIMLWGFAYFLVSQWQEGLTFFLSQVSEVNGSRYSVSPSIYVSLENFGILLVLNTLWKLKEFRKLKSQEYQAESTSQVSMKFVSWVNITGPEILSSSFWPNFQKQGSRKGKVNYFSIVIVLIYFVWVQNQLLSSSKSLI